jgi:predicted DNA-binding antitoxin AbrB/MazE fold protein
METIHAIYENGVFRPLETVSLPEKCPVELSVRRSEPSAGHPALLSLLEIAEKYPDDPDSPDDLAENLDHYLYGLPKRS